MRARHGCRVCWVLLYEAPADVRDCRRNKLNYKPERTSDDGLFWINWEVCGSQTICTVFTALRDA